MIDCIFYSQYVPYIERRSPSIMSRKWLARARKELKATKLELTNMLRDWPGQAASKWKIALTPRRLYETERDFLDLFSIIFWVRHLTAGIIGLTWGALLEFQGMYGVLMGLALMFSSVATYLFVYVKIDFPALETHRGALAIMQLLITEGLQSSASLFILLWTFSSYWRKKGADSSYLG